MAAMFLNNKMSNLHGTDRVYMKISDDLREELVRQSVLYKVPVYVACRQLGIKYATANNIVKLYIAAMGKGNKVVPRPKALDIIGSGAEIRNTQPSYTTLVSEIEEMTKNGEYLNREKDELMSM